MKRIMGLILACALVGTSFVGCGNKNSGNDEQNNISPTSAVVKESKEKAEEVKPEKAAEETKKSDVKLTVYALTSPLKEVLDAMCVDYEAETGVKVEWEIPPADQPFTVLKTRFATGDGPDIYGLGNGSFLAWKDRCADLSGSEWISNAYEPAKNGALIEGKQLGFPLSYEANGIIYNKDIFEKAGITKLPETLDELEDVCKTLKSQNIQAFGEAYKEWGFLMHLFGSAFAYEDDIVATNQKISNREMEVKDLKYIDNLFRFYDLTINYGFGAESIGYGAADQREDFANGKMAMIKQGTWYSSLININPDLKMGLFAIPLDNDASKSKLLTATTNYLAVNKDSANLEEAKAFLNWIHTNMGKYFVHDLKVAVPYDDVVISDMGQLFENVVQYENAGKTFGYFGHEFWPEGYRSDISTPFQAYAAGAMSKEEAIKELQNLYITRAEAVQ